MGLIVLAHQEMIESIRRRCSFGPRPDRKEMAVAYLLGYRSAVEWLRLNHDMSLLSQYWALPILSLEGSRRRLQRHAAEFSALSRPVHLVVGLRDRRCPSAETACHLLVSPDGDYHAVRIARGAYCSTPALTFLQMAAILDDATLRFLGMELCGRYGIDEEGELFLRQQTCRPDELSEMARRMTHVRGRRRAGAVAPQVIGGSASPMESALTLILCGTREEGGFGLPWPELNHALPVEGNARTIWDDDFITPDLLWKEARLVIEYDSELHHTAPSRIARDARRRDVLVELGYRVVTVTTQHMRTPNDLERIAQIVAQSTRSELAEPTDEEWARRMAWELRMRELAEKPDVLLGPVKELPEKRSWHVRRP